MKHHGGILADGIQHDRVFTLRGNFADDVQAFSLQPVEVGKGLQNAGFPSSFGGGGKVAVSQIKGGQ
jgi:hypothetical protein